MTPTLDPAHRLVITAGRVTGISHSRIYSTSRTARLVRIRWAIWHRLRTRHDWTFQSIAEQFGCDKSNVIHGVNRAAALIRTDAWFRALSNTLKSES